MHLQTNLGSTPVAALGVVTNLIVRAQTNPLRDRPILVGFLGQDLLGLKTLLRRHIQEKLGEKCNKRMLEFDRVFDKADVSQISHPVTNPSTTVSEQVGKRRACERDAIMQSCNHATHMWIDNE